MAIGHRDADSENRRQEESSLPSRPWGTMRRGELDPSSVSSAQSSTIIGRNLELPFDGDATNVARLAEQSNHKRRSSTTQDDTRMAAIGTTSDEESELNETTYGQNKSRPFYDPLQLSMAHNGERQKFNEKEKQKEKEKF